MLPNSAAIITRNARCVTRVVETRAMRATTSRAIHIRVGHAGGAKPRLDGLQATRVRPARTRVGAPCGRDEPVLWGYSSSSATSRLPEPPLGDRSAVTRVRKINRMAVPSKENVSRS